MEGRKHAGSTQTVALSLSKGAYPRSALRQAQGYGVGCKLFRACEARGLACKRGGHEHPRQDLHLVGRRDRRHAAEQLAPRPASGRGRSEEHTSELQSLMRISYAVFCLKTTKDREKKRTLNT